jgi:shikimate kinase
VAANVQILVATHTRGVPRFYDWLVPSRFTVVSGLPGSGKSTVGQLIANALTLPLLDKDDFLEALFAPAEAVPPAMRTALSRQSDDQFIAAARELGAAVLVSFWRRVEISSTSGTPIDWLRECDGDVVEIYCDCPPAIAAQRFRSRIRHPGHGDAAREERDLVEQLRALADFGPLMIGRTVRVDTSGAIDLPFILSQL